MSSQQESPSNTPDQNEPMTREERDAMLGRFFADIERKRQDRADFVAKWKMRLVYALIAIVFIAMSKFGGGGGGGWANIGYDMDDYPSPYDP